jgi:hypothetical protein
MDRLDAARKQILHKNGGGGELYLCKEERSAVATRLREAQEQTQALLGEEDALSNARAQCEKLTEAIRRQERICEYGEVNLVRRRFDTVIVGTQKLNAMQKELSERIKDGVDRSFAAQVKDSSAKLAEYNAVLTQIQSADEVLQKKHREATSKNEQAASEIESATSLAKILRNRMRLTMAMGLVILLLALLSAGAGWYLHLSAAPVYTVLLAAAGLLAVLAIICFIIRGRAKADLQDLLVEWDAPDVASLADAITDVIGVKGDLESLSNEARQMHKALTDRLAARRKEADRAFALAARVLPDVPVPDETDEDAYAAAAQKILMQTAERAEVICSEREEMQRAIDTLAGRLSVMQEELQGESEEEIRRIFAENLRTPEGKIASGLDGAKLDAAKKTLSDLQSQLREEEARYHDLKTQVAASRAVSISPVELAGRLAELDEQIESLSMRHEAYCLAMETL